MFVIQSVLLPKRKYNMRDDAKKEIGNMGFKKSIKPDPNPESKSYWRFRQRQPDTFDKTTFKTIARGDGVVYIVGKLK